MRRHLVFGIKPPRKDIDTVLMTNGILPPHYRKPDYSTRLFRAHYLYLAKYYDRDMFRTVCEELGVPLNYILVEDNWISDSFRHDLMERLEQRTGEKDLGFTLGRFTVSADVIPVEYAVNRSLLAPALYYLAVPLQYRRYNNVNSFKITKWRPGHFEYVAMPKGSTLVSPDVCRNTEGVLSATDRLFGLDKLSVKHVACIARGDKSCDFVIDYSASSFWKKRLGTMLAFGGFGLLSVFLLKVFGKSLQSNGTSNALFFLSYFLIGLCYFLGRRYLDILKYVGQYNEQSLSKSGELYDNYKKLDRKYHESNLLRGLSLKLSESVNTREVIKSCLEELDQRFGYSRSFVMLLSVDQSRLYTAETRGFEKGNDQIYALSIGYPAIKDGPELFAKILEGGLTRSIFDINKFKLTLKPENKQLVETLGVNSLIASPIQDKEAKYGLLVIGSVGREQLLTEEDQPLVDNISRLLSLSFQTASNFERETSLRTLFQKYVPAVVLSGLDKLAPGKSNLIPQNSLVTSMFIDLRDFSSRAERLPPERVVDLLNSYTDYVTARIAAAGGIIDKLVGDGINAFFPAKDKDDYTHAQAALLASLYILADLDLLSQIFTSRGYGAASLGIGLNTGWATIGNMGCDRKLDYTAVGDTINLAARLQDLCKDHRNDSPSAEEGMLLVSEKTLRQSKLMVPARSLGMMPIRGRDQTIPVYSVDRETAKTWVKATGRKYDQIKEWVVAENVLPVEHSLEDKRKVG